MQIRSHKSHHECSKAFETAIKIAANHFQSSRKKLKPRYIRKNSRKRSKRGTEGVSIAGKMIGDTAGPPVAEEVF